MLSLQNNRSCSLLLLSEEDISVHEFLEPGEHRKTQRNVLNYLYNAVVENLTQK